MWGRMASCRGVENPAVPGSPDLKADFQSAAGYQRLLKNAPGDRSLGEEHLENLSLSADKAVQGANLLPTVAARYAAVNA